MKTAARLGKMTLMFCLPCVLLISVISIVSRASIPGRIEKKTAGPNPGTNGSAFTPGKISLSVTRAVLAEPMTSRLQLLQDEGPQGYRNLVAIMFDEKLPMDARWRAVTALGRIGGPLSQPELKRALGSRDWYMRNAALVAASHINRPLAIEWSRKLISDKALVVRAAAVTTLQDLKDTSSAPLLWQKLYAKENFRGKQSLFIRRYIVEALARIENVPGHEGKFIEVLADNDESLHAPAIKALERLTQQSFGAASEPLKVKRAQWQHWWKEKSAQM